MLSIRLSIATAGAKKHNGWFQLLPDTGSWGTDYAYRAMIAVYAICANWPVEATYAAGVADNSGARPRGLRTATGSTSPRRDPAGERVLVADDLQHQHGAGREPYNKYSVGSNKGVTYNNDGSLDVYVQPRRRPDTRPTGSPTPPNSQFLIAMRLYGPKQSVLNGRYRYPTIQRVG